MRPIIFQFLLQMDNKQLSELYNQASQLSHDYPVTLARKIELLTMIQVEIGKRAADSVREYKRCYAERKRVYAEAYIAAKKDKAQIAELAVVELRQLEADLEADKVRWNNSFESNGEIINGLKYALRVLLVEFQNTGG